MDITPLVFTGISSFSDDFQTILDRSVKIASIPLTSLQNQQADLLSRKQLLTDLRVAVADLGASVTALGRLGESKAIQATVSNANRVTVSVTGSVGAGAHTISDISSVAKIASAATVTGYATADATAVSSDGILQLVVGDRTYTLDLTGEGANTLNGLRDAINALGAGVTATVLNTGVGGTPFYLSLAAEASGQKAFELRETAGRANTNLLNNQLPSENSVFTSDAGYATTDATEVSSDGLLELSVGGTTYEVDISGANTLEGLRDVINGLSAGVTAEIVDSGAAAGASRYRLKLTAAGGEAVELREDAGDSDSNLLTGAHQGANAVFKLDGLDVVKADNVVSDVVPGLTFTILSTTNPDEQVTISLSSSRASLATALADLVSKYNAVATGVNAQIGENAGLLSGDSIVRGVQSALRSLTTYVGSGTIQSLAALGIRLDTQGVMSFDSAAFYSLSNSDLASGFQFLGSATTGLGALAANFTAISDPATGWVKLRQDQYDAADERLQHQVDELSARINRMQTTLSAQLQQADSLLAMLDSQQQLLDASIQSLYLLLYGKKSD
jgi:flagellar hook-associated protein 2